MDCTSLNDLAVPRRTNTHASGLAKCDIQVQKSDKARIYVGSREVQNIVLL